MNKRIRNTYRLTTVIFVVLIFQSAVRTIVAQETKSEKCDKLANCLETFYKDCYDQNYLDTFSPKLVDNFTSEVTHEDEMSRLDVYLTILQNNEKATGYIIVYGGRTNKYGEYDIRVGRIKSYILGFRNQNENRFKFVNGGFREKFEFELWTSNVTNAFPPLSPTVAPEKVIFRGKMKPFSPY